MIPDRLSELIHYIAECNGTGRKELDQKVADGVLDSDDADLVFYYASVKKLNDKLNNISKKAERMINAS